MLLLLLLAACGWPPIGSPQQQKASMQPAQRTTLLTIDDVNDQLQPLPQSELDWALLLTDADPVVRQDAIDTLVETENTSFAELLEYALNDPHPGVRQAALEAMEELNLHQQDTLLR